jgi:hypothetical protein
MTRRLLLTLTLAATALAPVAAADAAKPAPYPTVSKVQPLSLGIGDTLTITGKNFTAGKNKNTVVFKRDGKKAIFVKAHTATKTTLSVLVPEKLRAALGKKDGAEVATKFRLRVLSKRFAKGYTALKTSPTIAPKSRALIAEEAKKAVEAATLAAAATQAAGTADAPPPPDCDRDGTPDSSDANDDADGLSDAFEAQIKTDRCSVDTDGDGMEDGWEYTSAFDLNRESCPNPDPYPSPCQAAQPAQYPVKKPYPNPLDPNDLNTDFDGDWLSAGLEHLAWKRKVGTARDFTQPLWYSDGLQASINTAGRSNCRGMPVPTGLFNLPQYPLALGSPYDDYSPDRFRRDAWDGCLNDGERDEDGDWLSNNSELNNALSGPDWWQAVYEEPAFQIAYEGTDWLDADTDGDGIIDAKDDQDHDDFWNIEEMSRGNQSANKDGISVGATSGLWVDAFNPCLPSIRSRTCPPAQPVQGAIWRPFYRDDDVPKPRWPLYGDPATGTTDWPTETWTGKPLSQQTLPPEHPLPR